MQKGQALIYVLAGVLILAIVAGGAYYLGKQTNTKPSYKACTMEAKICPDGSGVGRTGPNCEFAECPKVSPSPTIDETINWKTYTNIKGGYSFKYLPTWSLDETKANEDLNNQLILSNNGYQIIIWSNLSGIGGGLRLLPSTPIILDGLNLYEQIDEESYKISHAPDDFAFDYKGKTFDIIFSFPKNEKNTPEFQNNLETFHRLLSTFKFL